MMITFSYFACAGHERIPDDDDAERQAPLHLRQRRRIPGTFNGKFFFKTIIYLQTLCLDGVVLLLFQFSLNVALLVKCRNVLGRGSFMEKKKTVFPPERSEQ